MNFSPEYLDTYLVRPLRYLFQHFAPEDFRWAADPKVTGIEIDVENNFHKEAIQQKPRIIVDRGGYQVSPVGLSDNLAQGIGIWAGQGRKEGIHKFFINGSAVITVHARQEGSCEKIVNLVHHFLAWTGPLIADTFGFKSTFIPMNIGPCMPVSEDGEIFGAQITLPWMKEEHFSVSSGDKIKFKSFSLTLHDLEKADALGLVGTKNYILDAGLGVYTSNVNDADLRVLEAVSLDDVPYALSGLDTNFIAGRVLQPNSGVYNTTYSGTSLRRSRVLTASTSAYGITAFQTGSGTAKVLTTQTRTYSTAYPSTSLKVGRILTGQTRTYTDTHNNATLFSGSSPAISLAFEGDYTDTGTAGSVWTPSASGASISSTAPAPLAGTGSLLISSSTGYLETSAVAANMIPATGNWKLSFKGRWSNSAGKVLMSLSDPGETAAGTQFLIYISQAQGLGNASNAMFFYLSDGTTLTYRVQTLTLAQGTTYDIEFERVGTNLYSRVNGVVHNTTTNFTMSIVQPTGRKIRLGLSQITGDSGPPTMYVDNFTLIK